MGYRSKLSLIVEVTPDELSRCITEFHTGLGDTQWVWGTVTTIGKTLFTRLALHESVSELGDYCWQVIAKDVIAPEQPPEYCIITATPLPGWINQLGNILELNFWPDWNEYADMPDTQDQIYQDSYRKYLGLLLHELLQRRMIARLPDWINTVGDVKTSPSLRDGTQDAEGGAGDFQELEDISTTSDKKLIRYDIDGNIAHFRATMQLLERLYPNGWKTSQGNSRLVFWEEPDNPMRPPTWTVYLINDDDRMIAGHKLVQGKAIIEVYERVNDRVTIVFSDNRFIPPEGGSAVPLQWGDFSLSRGRTNNYWSGVEYWLGIYDHEGNAIKKSGPIGQVLKEFAALVIKEAQGAKSTSEGDEANHAVVEPLPSKRKAGFAQSKLVRSEVLPFDIEQFRAVMERLEILYNRIWVSSDGTQLEFVDSRHSTAIFIGQCRGGEDDGRQISTSPVRGSWDVSWRPLEVVECYLSRNAGLEAYEQPNKHTRVDFLDNYIPGKRNWKCEPIGPAFGEFCQMVIEEARQAAQVTEMTPTQDAGNGAGAESKSLRRKYLTNLRKILVEYFTEGELRTLCFNLTVDYDSLPGEGKTDKARELVIHLENRGRIPELVKLGRQQRPNVSWEDAPETEEARPTSQGPRQSSNRDSLRDQLDMAEKTLAVYEQQAAGYTTLTIPAPLAVNLEEQREKVTRLREQLST